MPLCTFTLYLCAKLYLSFILFVNKNVYNTIVYIYTTLEIDFIVNNLDQKIYIQSAYRIDNEKKNDSETNPFRQVNDNFKKVVMRNDIASSFYDENGIYHCKVIDFLLNRVSL